jgi:hypothetical protein
VRAHAGDVVDGSEQLGGRSEPVGARPLSAAVADQHQRRMVGGAGGIRAEGLQQTRDVLPRPGHQRPAGAGAELLRPGLEARGCVGDGIDGDRDQVHVAAGPVSQQRAQLAERRRERRADRGAVGEDEVDGHHLARDEIGAETELTAFLVQHGDVRHVQSFRLELVCSCTGCRKTGKDEQDQCDGGSSRAHNEPPEPAAPSTFRLTYGDFWRGRPAESTPTNTKYSPLSGGWKRTS